MVDTVEFYPVEVIKGIMDLTVGDILRVNPSTGRYELIRENEDIGDGAYSHDKFLISLEPWVIQKYEDYFQLYYSAPKGEPNEEIQPLVEAVTEDRCETSEDCLCESVEDTPNLPEEETSIEDLLRTYKSMIDKLYKDMDFLGSEVETYRSAVDTVFGELGSLSTELGRIRALVETPTGAPKNPARKSRAKK